jgi:hypothetical protein
MFRQAIRRNDDMKLTRRGLFGAMAATIGAAFVPAEAVRRYHIKFVRVSDVRQVTFSFWRNQNNGTASPLDREALTRAYNQCMRGGTRLQGDIEGMIL